MKYAKKSLLLFAICLSVFFLFMISACGPRTISVTFENGLSYGDFHYEILELYISPVESESTGNNLLREGLGTGGYIEIKTEKSESSTYDLLAVDSSGNQWIFEDIHIPNKARCVLDIDANSNSIICTMTDGNQSEQFFGRFQWGNVIRTTTQELPNDYYQVPEFLWSGYYTSINDFDYILDREAHTITLVHYNEWDESVLLSPVYNIDGEMYSLTSLGDEGCFFGRTDTISVYIPDGVTSMSDNCFNSCAVQYIYIPATMEHLSDNFFSYLHGYEVHYNSVLNLPAVQDNTQYRSAVYDDSAASSLGRSLGNALNGIMQGLSGETHPPVQLYFGGTEEQWAAIIGQ